MLKHTLGNEGFFIKVLFCVEYYWMGKENLVLLKTEFWLPFPPTIGLELNFQDVDYPPIKTVKYHLGTDKFTVILEEIILTGYNKDEILQRYFHCEEIK